VKNKKQNKKKKKKYWGVGRGRGIIKVE